MRVISMARGVAMLIGIAFDMPRDDRLDDEAAEIEALRVARIFWPAIRMARSGDSLQLLGALELLDILYA
jgi:hypothetical protein